MYPCSAASLVKALFWLKSIHAFDAECCCHERATNKTLPSFFKIMNLLSFIAQLWWAARIKDTLEMRVEILGCCITLPTNCSYLFKELLWHISGHLWTIITFRFRERYPVSIYWLGHQPYQYLLTCCLETSLSYDAPHLANTPAGTLQGHV